MNVDKLTYAGNLDSLTDVESDPRYAFARSYYSLFRRFALGD